MNKQRRETLSKLRGELEELIELTQDEKSIAEKLLSEEQENLKGGEKGELAQTAIEALENMTISLDSAVNELESAVGYIGDAIGE